MVDISNSLGKEVNKKEDVARGYRFKIGRDFLMIV